MARTCQCLLGGHHLPSCSCKHNKHVWTGIDSTTHYMIPVMLRIPFGSSMKVLPWELNLRHGKYRFHMKNKTIQVKKTYYPYWKVPPVGTPWHLTSLFQCTTEIVWKQNHKFNHPYCLLIIFLETRNTWIRAQLPTLLKSTDAIHEDLVASINSVLQLASKNNHAVPQIITPLSTILIFGAPEKNIFI
jgi:hypothetical protein